MIITVNGKITAALSPKRGTSERTGKEWMSQEFVIETENGDCICFKMFGEDKILNSGLKVGAIASVTCDVKSNDWKGNGQWFTNVSCVNCIVQGAAQPQQVPSAHTQAPVQPQPQHSSSSEVSANELPF
jgi:hypothetical protein